MRERGVPGAATSRNGFLLLLPYTPPYVPPRAFS